MKRFGFVVVILIVASGVFAQRGTQTKTYTAQLEQMLSCKEHPRSGKFLIGLQRSGFIGKTYQVMDAVSYFKVRRPLKVWSFAPVAVFGWEAGYPKFFDRGPGTAPPEMIGIVVKESVPSVNAKLEKLGMKGLHVEKADFDLRGKPNDSDDQLTEISCWANFKI